MSIMFPKKKWGTGKPKSKYQKRIAALDRIFQKYIRLRDSDKNGVMICISCSKLVILGSGEAHAGHFVKREKNILTRHHEQNVNGQCYVCNSLDDGNQAEHGRGIDKKYGPGTANMLLDRSKMKGKFHITQIEEKIKYYRRRVKELS